MTTINTNYNSATTNAPWFFSHGVVKELGVVGASGSARGLGVERPLLLNNLSYLNDPRFLAVDKNKSFIHRSCRVVTNSGRGTGNIGWISADSTTLDAQKAVRMCLDSVPMNSKKKIGTIYDPPSVDAPQYEGLHYSYDHLPGQIQYYVDPEMTNPFFSPLFPKDMKAFGAVYIDPMNNVSYDFRRVSGKQPLNCNDCDLAEFRDSQHHREDIQSSQMRTRNKREFEPIFFNFTSEYLAAPPPT